MARNYVLVLFLVACGGDASPVDKCDDLVDVVCDRAVECVPGGGTHAQCVQEIQQALPCGSAKSVKSTYDRCLDQLNDFSCSVLFPADPQSGQPSLELPADCMGVIVAGRTVPDTSPWSGLGAEVVQSSQSDE